MEPKKKRYDLHGFVEPDTVYNSNPIPFAIFQTFFNKKRLKIPKVKVVH